jgi:hypothetical protein
MMHLGLASGAIALWTVSVQAVPTQAVPTQAFPRSVTVNYAVFPVGTNPDLSTLNWTVSPH